MGRLRCNPSEPRYCWTKLCDCTVCEIALERYGPPPEPEQAQDEEDDDAWRLQPTNGR